MLGVGLRQLDCCGRGFESHWGFGCSSVVFVVCCVGNSLCDELITHSEESYHCVSHCVSSKMRWPTFLHQTVFMKQHLPYSYMTFWFRVTWCKHKKQNHSLNINQVLRHICILGKKQLKCSVFGVRLHFLVFMLQTETKTTFCICTFSLLF